MAELTDTELIALNREIERSGLTYTELQKELLDHLCCDIEAKMDEGIEFIRALDEVKKEIGSDGIKNIQEDTLLLINQKYRIMKKFMYILGTIAPSMVIIGTIFKIMHWPGASVLLSLGLFLLAAVYLPVFVSIRIRDTRNEGKPVNMAMYVMGMVSGIIFIAGALFKIMHWPGAGIMILLSGLVTVAVFIPLLVINAMRDKENQVQNFTVLIFVLSFIAITFMTFALSISKDVMNSFVIAIENDIRTEQVIDQNNAALRKSLSHMELSSDQKALADEVIASADQMNIYIDKVIQIIATESHPDNNAAVRENGEIDYRELLNKDDTKVPAEVMLGIDRDVAEGVVLKRMLEEYKMLAAKILTENDSSVEKALDTSDKIIYGDYEMSWVSYNFEHIPMMSAICQLTSIQLNSRIVEGQLLRHILYETAHADIADQIRID